MSRYVLETVTFKHRKLYAIRALSNSGITDVGLGFYENYKDALRDIDVLKRNTETNKLTNIEHSFI